MPSSNNHPEPGKKNVERFITYRTWKLQHIWDHTVRSLVERERDSAFPCIGGGG